MQVNAMHAIRMDSFTNHRVDREALDHEASIPYEYICGESRPADADESTIAPSELDGLGLRFPESQDHCHGLLKVVITTVPLPLEGGCWDPNFGSKRERQSKACQDLESRPTSSEPSHTHKS